MTKHTPGPWGVKYSTKRNGGPFEGWTEYDIHSHEGCFLVLRQYPGGDEADANAALMAAAPDLLEALIYLEAVLSEQSEETFEMELGRIREAIAKAEGK